MMTPQLVSYPLNKKIKTCLVLRIKTGLKKEQYKK